MIKVVHSVSPKRDSSRDHGVDWFCKAVTDVGTRVVELHAICSLSNTCSRQMGQIVSYWFTADIAVSTRAISLFHGPDESLHGEMYKIAMLMNIGDQRGCKDKVRIVPLSCIVWHATPETLPAMLVAVHTVFP
jgi:hypothetical protein